MTSSDVPGISPGVPEIRSAPTRAEVEALIASNDQRIAALAGRGVGIGAGSLAAVRVGMLCEYLLGDLDDERRREFEFTLGHKYAELIANVEAQAGPAVARSRLLDGVPLAGANRAERRHPPNGLHR